MSTGSYYVYILASRHHGTIYVGVTNDVRARLDLHRSGPSSCTDTRYSGLSMSRPLRHRKKRSHARSNWSSGSATGRSSWSSRKSGLEWPVGPHL